jgi:hypothetical protein
MDKATVKHLAMRGKMPAKPIREDLTFSERNPNFFKWFHESVMGFDSEEYRREFWREARKTGHTIGHVPYGLRDYHRRRDYRLEGAAIVLELLIGGGALAVWLMRRMIDRHIQRMRRPSYYETERARRLGLAEERRRIRRRRTTNAMPSNEELLEAFGKAKDSVENMIRFGSLIEDLECYVDNTPYFKNGHLVGRRGGIRRYLEHEIPELYARYKTVMKYKALSRKFRQATGIADPIPAASLIPEKEEKELHRKNENSVRNELSRKNEDGINQQEIQEKQKKWEKRERLERRERLREKLERVEKQEKSERREKSTDLKKQAGSENKTGKSDVSMANILAKEILEACEGSIISLAAQLEMRINPDYTPAIRASGISHDITANGKRQDLSSCRPTQRRYSPSHQCA